MKKKPVTVVGNSESINVTDENMKKAPELPFSSEIDPGF